MVTNIILCKEKVVTLPMVNAVVSDPPPILLPIILLAFLQVRPTISIPMGELFRQAKQDTLELTITERIWGAMLEFVTAMADIFGFEDQDIFDALINKSDELAHVCDLYRLKIAS